MDVKLSLKVKQIHLILLSCISFSAPALAQDAPVTLEPTKANLTIDNKDCVEASHEKLLQVTPAGDANNRHYQIKQFADWYQYTYGSNLKEQIVDRKIIGKRICHGVVSISNMELPFAKKPGQILDANDGILLLETAQTNIAEIKNNLQKANKIADDIAKNHYSPDQLNNFNTTFQTLLTEINRVASTAHFNGFNLFNGEITYLDVPIDNQKNIERIHLSDLRTGKNGLDIADLQVTTKENANTALPILLKAANNIDQKIAQFKAHEPIFKTAIKHFSVVTSIDLSGDEFIIQRYPQTKLNNLG